MGRTNVTRQNRRDPWGARSEVRVIFRHGRNVETDNVPSVTLPNALSKQNKKENETDLVNKITTCLHLVYPPPNNDIQATPFTVINRHITDKRLTIVSSHRYTIQGRHPTYSSSHQSAGLDGAPHQLLTDSEHDTTGDDSSRLLQCLAARC